MNQKQKQLARHALGLPNKAGTSYRNSFVTGPGSDDYDAWITMVAEGNAGYRDGKTVPFGGDAQFWLTYQGAQQALERNEKLDPEDFSVALP